MDVVVRNWQNDWLYLNHEHGFIKVDETKPLDANELSERLDGLRKSTVELNGQSVVRVLKMQFHDVEHLTLIVGVAFDIWYHGYDALAVGVLYQLRSEDKAQMRRSNNNVIHRITSVEKLESAIINDFVDLLRELGHWCKV